MITTVEHILLLGGAGYIGANLVAAMKSDVYDLHVYDQNDLPFSVDGRRNLTIHKGVVADVDKIEGVIETFHITIVVHLVSILIPGSSYED